jgi:hypothetical protein
MLLKSHELARIRDGEVTLAFRRWRRPSVRTGGTLLTAIGQLEIARVSIVAESDLTREDARRAGYDSLTDLLRVLNERQEGAIYRIELGGIRPDPRVTLRASLPDEAELAAIQKKLDGLDARSPTGPWTRRVLQLLADHSGVRAATLARRLGLEKLDFKARVRKLKTLGLTVSLETGYRLSPRGESVLARRPAGSL